MRAAQLVEWTTNIQLLKSTWLPGLFNPNSFLTAVAQSTSRAKQLPLDFMTNRSFFTNTREVGDLPADPPLGGVFIHGTFMEGASWEEGKGTDEGYIADSKMKELRVLMPICNIYSVRVAYASVTNNLKIKSLIVVT
jgi:dynein heavy chain